MRESMKAIISILVFLNMMAGLVFLLHRSAPPKSTYLRPLWMQTELTMNECGVKLDTGRAHLLARQVSRITETVFTERAQQEAFLVLLCIESQFNPLAKSKAGALGMAQVMPAYVNEFAKECSLPGTFSAQDLLDSEAGVLIGACQFRALLQGTGGNTALALAGYNSGAGSVTSRKLARGSNGAAETDGYLARFLVIQEKLK